MRQSGTSQRYATASEATDAIMSAEGHVDITLSAYQAHETCQTVLMFLSDYCDTLRIMDGRGSIPPLIINDFFDTLLALSSTPQNTAAAKRVMKFTGRVFQCFYKYILKGSKYCNEFCNSLLTYLAYRDESVRTMAAELLYLLMRFNFTESTRQSMSKVRVQITVALSKMDIAKASQVKLGLLLIQKIS